MLWSSPSRVSQTASVQVGLDKREVRLGVELRTGSLCLAPVQTHEASGLAGTARRHPGPWSQQQWHRCQHSSTLAMGQSYWCLTFYQLLLSRISVSRRWILSFICENGSSQFLHTTMIVCIFFCKFRSVLLVVVWHVFLEQQQITLFTYDPNVRWLKSFNWLKHGGKNDKDLKSATWNCWLQLDNISICDRAFWQTNKMQTHALS